MTEQVKISPRRKIAGVLRAIGLEYWPLLLLILVIGGTWSFVELADEVGEGDTLRFDREVLLALRRADDPRVPLGPLWLEDVARDITALGGTAVITLIIGSVAGLLLIKNHRKTAYYLLASVLSGSVTGVVLKGLFNRPRPEFGLGCYPTYLSSFPSGHSMLSALTYLTLGALLAGIQTDIRSRIYIMVMFMLVTVIVGVSRVYLGLHWPTDVLGGWTAGAIWAMAWGLVARWALGRDGPASRRRRP